MSCPGPFYSHPGSIQTTLKPSSPVERQVVIHAARVQLGLFVPEKGSAPAIACSATHPHAPFACSACPRACKYVHTFPPCVSLLHPVVTLPSLQLFRASSRHSKCLPQRPAQHLVWRSHTLLQRRRGLTPDYPALGSRAPSS